MKASSQDSLLASLAIHYKRGDPEHYDAWINTLPTGEVCVRLSRPVVGESCYRLHASTLANEPVVVRALHSLVNCFFGESHASPRIVGTPDWDKVTLELAETRERRPRRILLLELTADASGRGTFLRANGTRALRDESVTLCPEDADPVYAMTRLALSHKGALVDKPAVVASSPARAPVRQRQTPVPASQAAVAA